MQKLQAETIDQSLLAGVVHKTWLAIKRENICEIAVIYSNSEMRLFFAKYCEPQRPNPFYHILCVTPSSVQIEVKWQGGIGCTKAVREIWRCAESKRNIYYECARSALQCVFMNALEALSKCCKNEL